MLVFIVQALWQAFAVNNNTSLWGHTIVKIVVRSLFLT